MAEKKKDIVAEAPRLEDIPEIPREEQPHPLPDGWKWVTIDSINQYVSKNIDPAFFPDKTFELYSVPSSNENYPEIVRSCLHSLFNKVRMCEILINASAEVVVIS